MTELESAREVIDALGGLKAVEALTGRKTTTVSAWQAKFNSFPAELFVLMTEELRTLGYTAPKALWRQIERPDDSQECEVADA